VEEEMPVDRQILEQFELMVRARPEVRAFPDHPRNSDEDFSHLYRAGSLLMRNDVVEEVAGHVERRLNVRALDPDSAGDAGEVRAFRAVGDDPPDAYLAEQVVPGLTRLRFAEGDLDTASAQPGVLAELDDRVGAGIVRPEAVLHCCGHGCPAREPEVPSGTSDPYPAPDRSASADAGRGVLISLVDSGLIPSAATDHWWMQGVDGDVEATLDTDGNIQFYGGHGTFGAGCARVTAPGANLYVDGSMTVAGVAYETEIVVALADALRRRPDVVVFTFAATTHQELSLLGFDVLYDNVIRHLDGTVFLAPAGNDGVGTLPYPAAYPWVLSVGALGSDWRTRASFSNFGEQVQVFAPGEDLVNAYATGRLICKESPNIGETRTFEGMASWSGTSFSTPLVAGMIAARMSATGEDARQAADALLELARSQAVDDVGPVLLPGQVPPAAAQA
jgi:subtilisin family serine protease